MHRTSRYAAGLLAVLTAAGVPSIASANLVTFQFTGFTDQILLNSDTLTSYPVTVDMTVDTNAIGMPLGMGELFNITQPGTGLSVTLDGLTVFAGPLSVYIETDQPTSICNPVTDPPRCDTFGIESSLAKGSYVSAGPTFGEGLSAPTLSALAEAPLQNFHGNGLDPDLILEWPEYNFGQIFANIDQITVTGVSEPPMLWLAGTALASALLGTRIRRRLVGR